jgi:hypothetical protein
MNGFMMMPYEDPNDWVSVFENYPCPFHKIAPGESYPGCTCSAKYFRRKATPEEREANIKSANERAERRAEAMRAIGVFGK